MRGVHGRYLCALIKHPHPAGAATMAPFKHLRASPVPAKPSSIVRPAYLTVPFFPWSPTFREEKVPKWTAAGAGRVERGGDREKAHFKRRSSRPRHRGVYASKRETLSSPPVNEKRPLSSSRSRSHKIVRMLSANTMVPHKHCLASSFRCTRLWGFSSSSAYVYVTLGPAAPPCPGGFPRGIMDASKRRRPSALAAFLLFGHISWRAIFAFARAGTANTHAHVDIFLSFH